jgi:DNA repair exonuclease SbcCD ATPase subunit
MRGGNISGNTAAGDLNAGNNISETERYRIFTDSRGRVVTTYLFEVKTNVRHFFDDESGTWERMPLEWEAEIPEVRLLINQVKKLVPDMTEHKEIVQQLRDSNYQLSGLLKHIDVTDSIKKSIESEGEGRGSAEVIMQERLIGGTIEHAVNSEAAEKTKKLIERYEKDLADKEEKLGDLRDLNKNMERELERLKKMVEEGARDRHKITAEFETLRVAHNAEREKSTSLIKELNDYRRSGGDKFNEVVTQKDEQLLKLRYAVSTLQARLTKEAEKQTKVMTIIGNLGKLHEQLKVRFAAFCSYSLENRLPFLLFHF